MTLSLVFLASPALGQGVLDLLQGTFGSALDPAAACDTNPHSLAIVDDRPHLARIWEKPVTGSAGAAHLREVYDLEAVDGMALTLAQEGPYHADPDDGGKGEGAGGGAGGGAVGDRIWVLQFTQTPAGYCWRRPDWPAARCIQQQLRCEAPTS